MNRDRIESSRRALTVIGAPLEDGAGVAGTVMGPAALRTAGLIREINRTQALIVVEHDMQFIRMIARTVTVFNQGGILVEDEVENVLANQAVRDVYLGKQAA